MAQKTLRDYLQETEDAITSGHIDDALTRCQYVLTYFPEALEAQRLLGEVYLAQEDLENAQQMFDWILMNDPENVLAYCNRALISERLSDFETALDCYQQAYELSRGNSQIRQQFNELGAKTGQPSFMLSRAGLARLYMWGDLLSQAMQEWEAVLSVSPDRLDARLGLMETYWYEGLYDQVEQLARQILLDVPGCLKALLLLAAVVAEKNLQEAQELLQRAETLDPELVIGQELFADMIANQSTHPFIKLLKKPPVLLEVPSAKVVIAPVEEPIAALQASALHSLSPNAFAHWNELNEWNGVDTPVKPRQNAQLAPSALPVWQRDGAEDHPAQNGVEHQGAVEQDDGAAIDPWAMLERSAYRGSQEDDQREVQQSSQEPAEAYVPHDQYEETPAREAEDPPTEVELDGVDAGEAREEESEAFATGGWMLATKDEYMAATPGWLSMLTQEQHQQAGDAPPIPEQPSQEQKPSVASPAAQQTLESEPVFYAQPSQEAELQAASGSTDDDEESFFFGPDWLKSLGATMMDDAPEADAVLPTLQQPAVLEEPEPEPKAVFSPWTVQTPEPEPQLKATSHSGAMQGPELEPQLQEQAVLSSWTAQVSQSPPQKGQDAPVPPTPPEVEQSFLKTLEDLEQSLKLQGFVALEPNSLSAVAQEVAAQDKEEEQEEPTLSSALAQLGNFAPPVAPTLATPVALTQPVPQPEPGIRPVEPLWLASLSVSSPPRPNVSPVPLAEPVAPSVQSNVSSSSVTAPLAPLPMRQEPPVVPPAHIQEPVGASARVDALPGPIFQPKPEPTPTPSPSPQPAKVPVGRGDAGIEDELEMTMKRPAVRLPAAQQRSLSGRQEGVVPSSKGYAGERPASVANKAADSGSNYKERLLKGYQHQLVGDYDEAMQEYRIIIRNTPELLGEVVSNVRALLKLAPKYSAGYRVLGDAYMRQGEYLQAMEAYNKALTMAKKAKA
jgi:tetratricopeptide (TPR) repeat protein